MRRKNRTTEFKAFPSEFVTRTDGNLNNVTNERGKFLKVQGHILRRKKVGEMCSKTGRRFNHYYCPSRGCIVSIKEFEANGVFSYEISEHNHVCDAVNISGRKRRRKNPKIIPDETKFDDYFPDRCTVNTTVEVKFFLTYSYDLYEDGSAFIPDNWRISFGDVCVTASSVGTKHALQHGNMIYNQDSIKESDIVLSAFCPPSDCAKEVDIVITMNKDGLVFQKKDGKKFVYYERVEPIFEGIISSLGNSSETEDYFGGETGGILGNPFEEDSVLGTDPFYFDDDFFMKVNILIANGDLESIKRLVDKHGVGWVTGFNSIGISNLYFAVSCHQVDIVEYFLSKLDVVDENQPKEEEEGEEEQLVEGVEKNPPKFVVKCLRCTSKGRYNSKKGTIVHKCKALSRKVLNGRKVNRTSKLKFIHREDTNEPGHEIEGGDRFLKEKFECKCGKVINGGLLQIDHKSIFVMTDL